MVLKLTILKIATWLRQESRARAAVAALGIFLLFVAVYGAAYTTHAGFFGTDSYYHARHSALILTRGWTYVDNWAALHFLSVLPADPWWLSHMCTAAFIAFFGVVAGAKAAAAVSAATVFAVWYAVARGLYIRYAAVWTMLLFFGARAFSLRLLLERPYVMAIALMVAAWYLAQRRRYGWLCAVTLVYTLWYNLTPLVVGTAVVVMVAERLSGRGWNLRPVTATLAGMLVGVVIHPHALGYLHVVYIHTFAVFGLKLAGVDLPLGREVQFFEPLWLMRANAVWLTIVLSAVAVWLGQWRAWRRDSALLSLGILSMGWLLVALVVPRGIEYAAPFGMLFAALVINRLYGSAEWRQLRHSVQTRAAARYCMATIIAVLLIALGYSATRLWAEAHEDPAAQERQAVLAAGEWIHAHAPAGERVFHTEWSMFPLLVYASPAHQYFMAFTPPFMYDLHPRMYTVWLNLAYHGVYCAQPWPCWQENPKRMAAGAPAALRYDMGARYVVAQKKWLPALYATLQSLPTAAEVVYENEYVAVFYLR